MIGIYKQNAYDHSNQISNYKYIFIKKDLSNINDHRYCYNNPKDLVQWWEKYWSKKEQNISNVVVMTEVSEVEALSQFAAMTTFIWLAFLMGLYHS